jgi:hypothetical protein
MLRFQSLQILVFRSPQNGSSTSKFPSRSPYKRATLHSKDLQTCFSVPEKNPPPTSPCRAPTERDMFHLQSPLCISCEVSRKETSFQVPLTEPLHRERCSISRALFKYLLKSSEKTPPRPRIPLRSPYVEKDAPSPAPSLHTSQSPQKRKGPLQVPLTEPLHKERLFHLQSPLYVSFTVPRKKEPPSRFPSQTPIERDAPFSEPSFTCVSKSPVKEPPLQVPHRGPYGERCSSPGSSRRIIQNAQSRTPPLPRFSSQSPHREGHSVSRARIYSPLKGPGKEPLPGSPTGPKWKDKPIPRAIINSINSFTAKGIRLPSAEPHMDGRPTYSGVCLVAQGDRFRHCCWLPQCHAAFSTIPSTMAWVDQSPISQYVLW